MKLDVRLSKSCFWAQVYYIRTYYQGTQSVATIQHPPPWMMHVRPQPRHVRWAHESWQDFLVFTGSPVGYTDFDSQSSDFFIRYIGLSSPNRSTTGTCNPTHIWGLRVSGLTCGCKQGIREHPKWKLYCIIGDSTRYYRDQFLLSLLNQQVYSVI